MRQIARSPIDLIIHDGLVFDGKGGDGVVRNIAISGGKIVAISKAAIIPSNGTRVIDARGKWVCPGFVDLHTHYDAEIEMAPALVESVRHGVTTVVLGSCSLSLALGSPQDLADQFARVEAIPYDTVRSLLEKKKTWTTLGDYYRHLDSLALGPNIASFIGHSGLRAHVMGIERAVDEKVAPTSAELRAMESHIKEGLDEGYLGLSIQTLPWDKLGGSRQIRSKPLPSTYARWSEIWRLVRPLRERNRVFQGVPNITTKLNVLLFLLTSAGIFRKALKTTIISMMDTRATRGLHVLIGWLSRFFNIFLGADFRWQALPDVFELWADGLDLVVFEEFGAGAAALHLEDAGDRARLLGDPEYRALFRRQWRSKILPKVFHRDFNYSTILSAPDPTLVGKSFAEVGRERGTDAVDAFLDLVVEYGDSLRWRTVMANDRPKILEQIVSHPDVLIGFSDAGAHLRNMAHYNFPLRLLRLVRQAQLRGEPFMSVGRAVRRVSGEIAEWIGLDTGTLEIGKQADIVIVDPNLLGSAIDEPIEEAMVCYGGIRRMVNQNGGAVSTVIIRGREAMRAGEAVVALGRERKFGRLLRHRDYEASQPRTADHDQLEQEPFLAVGAIVEARSRSGVVAGAPTRLRSLWCAASRSLFSFFASPPAIPPTIR
ncbi:MAG: amidohydrolase family protein [Polyangiaceae bacterium]